MFSLGTFLFIYILGGITFLPLLLLISIFYFFGPWSQTQDTIQFDYVSPEDQNHINNIKQMRDNEDRKFHKFGWLRVTREYPSGSPTNGASFGNMMKQSFQSIMEGRNTQPKRPKNSYFAVLKHNTLFMYDSEGQTEYKGIIIVSHHDISIYPEALPDNEIYFKAHSIRLTKKQSICADMAVDIDNRDYFLFCDVAVDKEDWYFALLGSSKLKPTSPGLQPQVARDKAQFDQEAMTNLSKSIYSDGEHYQTQWLNAILGRIFLGVYKTQAVQEYFVRKLVKKIKRVKKPNFLSEIHIKSVDVGSGIPLITNPKLLELAPNGDLSVDVHLDYSGGFRVEIETKADILTTRLKVQLVLAVVLKRLQGKMLLRIKAPPTNRLWVGFYEMPKLDLLIEPVVSSTQIKFSMVTKAIEAKIREMIMESVVLPNMDDTPFSRSFGLGGIFEGDVEADEATKEEDSKETIPDIQSDSGAKSDNEKEKSDKHHLQKPSGEDKSEFIKSATPGQIESNYHSRLSPSARARIKAVLKTESEPDSVPTKDLPFTSDTYSDSASLNSMQSVSTFESTNSADPIQSPTSPSSISHRWSSIRRRTSQMGIAGILTDDSSSRQATTATSAPIPIVTISSTSLYRKRSSAASSETSTPLASPLGSPSNSPEPSPSGSVSGSPGRNSPNPTPPPSPSNLQSDPSQILSSSYPPKKSIGMNPAYGSSVKSLPIIRDCNADNDEIFFGTSKHLSNLMTEDDEQMCLERQPILDPPVDELKMVLG